MFKKLSASIMIAAMLFASLPGCSSTSGEKLESTADTQQATETKQVDATQPQDNKQKAGTFSLYTYYAESGKVKIDKAIELLKEIYPNVTINVEHRTDADGNVLKTRAAIGELPDIFECAGTLIETFVKSNDILSLDDMMEKMKYRDLFIDGMLDGIQSSDGKIYGCEPIAPELAVFYYNKKVFADNGLTPPKNYPEFLQIVKTLKSKDIIPLALFAQHKWPGLQIYDLAVVSQEPKGMVGLEDGTTKITDKAYVDAAEKIYELVNAGFIGKGAFNTDAGPAFEMLKVGQAAMLFNGSWYFGDAKEYGDNIGFFEYNPFTDPGNEEQSRWNASGGANSIGGYAASAKGNDPEFAKEILLNFVACKVKAGVIELGEISILKENVEPKTPRYEAFNNFANNMPGFKTFSKFEWSLNSAEMKVILEDSTEKLFAGFYEPAKFIADVEKSLAGLTK